MNSQNMISRAIFCDPVSLVKKEEYISNLEWEKGGSWGGKGGSNWENFQNGPFSVTFSVREDICE